MKQSDFVITENIYLNNNVLKMVLCGDTEGIVPGQFVNIKLDGFYLRRPISVCDIENGRLTIIYKIVGRGTKAMAEMKSGTLNLLTGLGNGYDLSAGGEKPLLIGGGAGVPPMYYLAKELLGQGKEVCAVLGFNKADEVFYEKEFTALGCKTFVTTVDGSYAAKGFVTDIINDIDYTYFYACGPEPMLKAVYKSAKTDGELSFEERMGCGFGACMGCSCKTVTGFKRICKDGPVLKKEEILWEK